ncbi:family 16 glycosylhydrolase [Tamlana fucoidanivorans]|uniref:Glycosyl hydrolase family protein n=1 Tax=Allotamlana fucoidanivorans TaxID=2583814 RepID=A0A5C4SGJ6_9FLAO|nr:family 16 glycosylhydrolase [Tamlana fucoidanivorans]TNJ42556.1 glycosyl hydrolase family protein [Tamlana fucoidanivorans]
MKNIKLKYGIGLVLALTLVFTGCQDDDASFGDIKSPTDVTLSADVICEDCNDPEGDGSGLVNLVATSSGALAYKFDFGDGFSETNQSGRVTHRFTKVDVNTYTVVVNAVGTGGVQSSTSINVTVRSDFEDPEAKDFLSGGAGSSKTWYWAADKPSNIALGSNVKNVPNPGDHTFPTYFNSDPFHPDKLCMYDAELVFTQDADGNLTFQQTVGQAYIPGTVAGSIGVDGDTCHGKDIVPSLGETSNVALIPSSSVATEDAKDPEYRGTTILLSDDGFMSWYCKNSLFEIITITDSKLYVRVVDGVDPGLAWYCTFQTQNPNESGGFEDLVWSDEFDVDGAPNAANWTYDLGSGGWGNGELQTYTNNAENVIVENGVLKITAKADGSGGYTSARIKTEGLQEYKYGKIEARAKLPASQGTWPAVWMLGANFADVGWPNCGEIDIMEQTGQDKTKTSGALHFPGNSGGDAIVEETTVANTATEFHVYTVEWTAESIKMSVDGDFFFSYDNNEQLPYNADFFMILNVAMGGSLGGTVDPNFTEDTMEIDYIRVYQ